MEDMGKGKEHSTYAKESKVIFRADEQTGHPTADMSTDNKQTEPGLLGRIN